MKHSHREETAGPRTADLMTTPSDRLVDSYGRPHNNLRISVTDRCNIRCVYCMPEQVEFLPRAQLLTFEEIERFVRIAAPMGIDKIRLTGGEPLVRRDVPRLIEKLAAIPGIKDIGLTTNGILLAPPPGRLRDAGLERINISLDTMDPAKFERLTRRTGFEQVIEGILAAKEAGFDPVKVNAVAIRGVTEDDVAPLARFCRAARAGAAVHRVHAARRRAPMGARQGPVRGRHPRDPGPRGRPAVPLGTAGSAAPALDYEYQDGGGLVGIIASVSRPFCMSCNRLRLTSDGKLRNCLFSLDETDVRALLRGGATDEAIMRAIRESVASKWEGHEINTARFIQPDRLMHSIGG